MATPTTDLSGLADIRNLKRRGAVTFAVFDAISMAGPAASRRDSWVIARGDFVRVIRSDCAAQSCCEKDVRLMHSGRDIWALIPVKETIRAKSRLDGAVSSHLRQGLALAMLEDVLSAAAGAPELAGVILATLDPEATRLAKKYAARVITEGARDGHTGAVRAAAKILAAEGRAGILQMPLDIPLVSRDEIATLVSLHAEAPAFTIAPSDDEHGSNGIIVSPPDRVPLSFGDDSFFPHLRTAEECGVRPRVVRLPGFGLDIDRPGDLSKFAARGSRTRTQAYIERHRLARRVVNSECKVS